MIEPDQDDVEVRAAKNHQGLHSIIEDMFDMVNEGQGRWLDEAHLILMQGKIESLRGYMRANRAAA